jgi:hypothetical protein
MRAKRMLARAGSPIAAAAWASVFADSNVVMASG